MNEETTVIDGTGEIEAAENQILENVQSGPEIAAEHEFGAQYSTRVTLRRPLARASASMEPLTCLYLREPKAGDLRGVKLAALLESDAGELLKLLPRIAMPRLAPGEAAGLTVADTVAVFRAVSDFLQ